MTKEQEKIKNTQQKFKKKQIDLPEMKKYIRIKIKYYFMN